MSLLQIASGMSVPLADLKPEEAGVGLLALGLVGVSIWVLNRWRMARLAQRERSNFDVHADLAGYSKTK